MNRRPPLVVDECGLVCHMSFAERNWLGVPLFVHCQVLLLHGLRLVAPYLFVTSICCSFFLVLRASKQMEWFMVAAL